MLYLGIIADRVWGNNSWIFSKLGLPFLSELHGSCLPSAGFMEGSLKSGGKKYTWKEKVYHVI